MGENIVYNDTDTREFTFVVNNKNETRGKNLLIEGLKCLTGVCDTGSVADVAIEADARFWSDPNSWPSGELPKEGEDVFVEPGWNMYYDLPDSPVYNSVEVNGRLTFYNDGVDRTFNSHRIYVRAGELLIGNETHPFEAQATIVLHGA